MLNKKNENHSTLQQFHSLEISEPYDVFFFNIVFNYLFLDKNSWHRKIMVDILRVLLEKNWDFICRPEFMYNPRVVFHWDSDRSFASFCMIIFFITVVNRNG